MSGTVFAIEKIENLKNDNLKLSISVKSRAGSSALQNLQACSHLNFSNNILCFPIVYVLVVTVLCVCVFSALVPAVSARPILMGFRSQMPEIFHHFRTLNWIVNEHS